MVENVIEITDLTKVYNLYSRPVDRLREALSINRKKYSKAFYALDNINFNIQGKQAIGIIGTNGSGKSTLLKIICGVLSETAGTVKVNGKISALLELGAGFNPEYTGIQNIYLNGSLMGYSKQEVEEKINAIMDFADIGEFIYQPVKTYSSGMFARLAFAVSINVEPDILIVDEALSVGDIRFQQKCFRKMEEIKREKTVLMVSHDLGAINKFCDKVIWIEKGKLLAYGEPSEVIKEYQAYLMESKVRKTAGNFSVEKKMFGNELQDITTKYQCYGNKNSEIMSVGLFRKNENTMIATVLGGEELVFVIKVHHQFNIEDIIVGITVSDRLGNNIFGINSYLSNDNLDSCEGVSIYSCKFKMPELNEGPYTISPAIAQGTQITHTMLHWVYDAYVFDVISKYNQVLPGVLAISDFKFEKLM